jgi:glutamate--cysteine ligase
MVPHLITALNGPINELEQRILESLPAIERWFRLEWMEHTPPFYTSVDVRNAGYKLAPVDTNLFPGGFNNLTAEMLPLAVQAAMAAIEKICPEAKNLLLIPEKHTRNSFYLANVPGWCRSSTGRPERAPGHPRRHHHRPHAHRPARRHVAHVEPLVRTRGRLGLKDFDPCTILLNNDLSAGLPKVLEGPARAVPAAAAARGLGGAPQDQPLPGLRGSGQEVRQAAGHGPVAHQPDVLPLRHRDQLHHRCRRGGAGQTQAEALLAKIRRKHKEYGIQEKPVLIVVKADAGTYGMGIMTVRDPKELADLNRKTRNKMSVIKDGQEVSEVILQEGVPTYERVNDAVAEPVVYMIDRYVVGGFYRVNAERGVDENLNSPGAGVRPAGVRRVQPAAEARASSQAPAPRTASTCTA